jgi:Zn-dependent protease
VFLFEPAETPYDLRWRMFGVPIRVHPLFWLITIILGWPWTDVRRGFGFGYLALWVGCVFVSILLHEFGHVMMGKLFGSHGRIVLYGMGGLAIGSKDVRWRWQRILVSLAGPGVQLLLYAGLRAWLAWGRLPVHLSPEAFEFVVMALGMLLLINFYWPIVNLLPIWPLDGGQVTRDVCEGVLGLRGVIISLWISIIVSAGVAVAILAEANDRPLLPFSVGRSMFNAMFAALFAVSSYQALQYEQSRQRQYQEDLMPWER